MMRIRFPFLRDQSLPSGSTLALGLILAAAIPALGVAVEEAEPKVDSWYAQTVARGPAGLNVNYFWSLGPKFRAETVAAGHKIVTIVNGDTYYAYDAVRMSGVAIRRTTEAIASDAVKRRPFGNEVTVLLSQGAEKVREEVLFNVPSEVYQISDGDGRRIVWVTQDSRRLPMRIEIFDRQSGTTNYKEYFDWQHGFPIAAAFFEPEPAADLRRFDFEEYIGKMDDREVMGLAPILYEDLLVGSWKPADAAGASSPR